VSVPALTEDATPAALAEAPPELAPLAFVPVTPFEGLEPESQPSNGLPRAAAESNKTTRKYANERSIADEYHGVADDATIRQARASS
jgi:hypothetical protein